MFAIVMTLLTAVWLWALWCNWLTYEQRNRLLFGPANGLDGFWEAWRTISYDRHFWLLLTFRKPRYPAPLGDA